MLKQLLFLAFFIAICFADIGDECDVDADDTGCNNYPEYCFAKNDEGYCTVSCEDDSDCADYEDVGLTNCSFGSCYKESSNQQIINFQILALVLALAAFLM
ncbi:hypothetical protein PPERSA_06051 [Pseudocohnilembus persalinus]|uniref:Transmembrane protein n=1 Tax=Pseudocohnilembus persalinus TaxID=266149 RepID=A0A0V0QUW7_PSEPJ|nr:hypothetical protein PPERSA_06051 [Pseudocohnilembus persalinus]|eukprot:KRX06169.1 hypothetical protein PPERSA_06051 [Pseudocohnilembus persalinus]